MCVRVCVRVHVIWCVITGLQAGKLARDRGWAINIGGGFHHCSSNEGGGFCAYADITLCVKVTSIIASLSWLDHFLAHDVYPLQYKRLR